MKWLILVLVIQFCIRISKSAASLNGGITFDLALIDSSHIQFTITYRSSGWVGFGYGTCMCSNDMFVIQASGGAGTISDMTMNGHNYPNMDAVNDYTLSTSTSGSINTYTVTRLLSDGDSGDYQFKNGTTYIVYAWGSGSMSNHGSNYGSFSFNLVINSGTSSGGSSSGGSGSSSSGSSGSSSSGSTGSSSSGDAGSSSGGSSGSTSNSGSGNNSNGNSGGSSNSGGSCGSCSFGSSSINTGGGIVTIDDSNTRKHGVLLYVSWGWLCFFLILTGRYSKYFYFINTLLHIVFGLTVLLITLFSVFTISDVVAYTSNTSAPGQNHRSLGYALTYLCISIVGLGFLSKASMLCCRYLTLWMKYVRFAHSSIGYIVIFYSQYVILSGLYAFQVSTRNLYFIQIIAIILCFLIIEIAFCLINKKYYKAFIKINKKNLKTMSLKAFNESNKKLALFNDYVVDLTLYAYEHPGGTFVIQQCNKKDIGKYIYGAYSMEDNVSPHKHSFIAMKIVERLICARIVPERQFDNEIESRRSVARFEDSQQFIEASICNIKRSSCYKVGKCVNFQNNLYRVVFEDTIDSDHYIFREGLGFIGKHYVVISEKNQVARYYTICQTFHSKVYKQYLDAFDNVLTGKKFERKFETIEQISNETSNSIELFMKFYTQSKNGITKQISSAAQEDRFIVSGIFGKGLNLEKQNIVGSNLIVVGGTGILPFIDLFAYLARRLISKKAEMSQVFFREVFESYIGETKFLIFAFYPDKTTAVGVEFCEKISQLFLHFGLKHNFKFLPRYTRNGDPKISNEDDVLIFIEEVLAKTKIKNLFVCGPPSMNNAFQQATIKICSQFKFEPNQIEII